MKKQTGIGVMSLYLPFISPGEPAVESYGDPIFEMSHFYYREIRDPASLINRQSSGSLREVCQH
jgi:hypothetical protein